MDLIALGRSTPAASLRGGYSTGLICAHQHQRTSACTVAQPRIPAVWGTSQRRAALAADELYWSETVAGGAQNLTELAARAGASSVVLWSRGRVTDRCRQELEKLGWKVEAEVELDAK